MFDDELKRGLEQRRLEQRYRQRRTVTSAQQPHLSVDGEAKLAFCSNDYLGLANHPAVIEAMQKAAAEVGVGSGASHLVCGHSQYHHQLEDALAEFTGRERAILFSTGYMANLGVIAALVGRGDTVLEDRLNHASLIDGGLLSRANFKRFHHNDMAHLEKQLAVDSNKRQLVVVDGVFSMDGDLAPLDEISKICEQHQAILMVDDAHGFGVLGTTGGGCAEHWQLDTQQLPVLVGTLGKGFGTFGAFVAGSEALIETLIQFARPYIYTTAMPPAVAAATLASLKIVKEENWRRQNLLSIIKHFREGAEKLGLPLMASQTPIQPIVIGDDGAALEAAKKLEGSGVLVSAIRPPTVPEGTARLRVTFSANHSLEDVDQLLAALDQAVPQTVRVA